MQFHIKQHEGSVFEHSVNILIISVFLKDYHGIMQTDLMFRISRNSFR